MTSLVTTPKTYRFSYQKDKEAEKKFHALLRLHESTTEHRKIIRPEDLIVDQDGRLGAKFAMTTTSLGQICSKTVPINCGSAQRMDFAVIFGRPIIFAATPCLRN